MAKNTAITAVSTADQIMVANNIKVWSRVVDAAVTGLTSGDHFELFSMPAGTLVISGIVEVLTVDAGGGAFTVGIGGTGNEYVTSTNVNALLKKVITNAGVMLNSGAADTIDLAAANANLTTAKIRITLITLDVDAARSSGAVLTA